MNIQPSRGVDNYGHYPNHSNHSQHSQPVSAGKLQDDWRRLQIELYPPGGTPFDPTHPSPKMKQKLEHFIKEAKAWAKENPKSSWAGVILERVGMLDHALKLKPISYEIGGQNGFKMQLDARDAFNRTFSNLQTSINDLTLDNPALPGETPYGNLTKD